MLKAAAGAGDARRAREGDAVIRRSRSARRHVGLHDSRQRGRAGGSTGGHKSGIARRLLVLGLKAAPTVEYNGKPLAAPPELVEANGQKAYAIPLNQ